MFYFISFLFFTLIPQHDFHTSWFNFTYDEQIKAFEVSWQTDTEHLEGALTAFSSSEVQLDPDASPTQIQLLEDYINTHFNLTIDQKKHRLFIREIEVNFAETFIHFEALKHKKRRPILQLENTLLIQQFPNQRNMVQVNYMGLKYSMLFSRQKIRDNIVLDQSPKS